MTQPRRRRNKPRRGRKPSHAPVREANLVSGFPRTQRVTLTYAETIVIHGTASVLNTSTQYRANGAYDPKVAVGGDTPFNFATWSRMFNHYVVMASRITFRIGHSGSDTAVTTGIYLADDTTALPYTTPGPLIGARRGTYTVLPHIITGSTPHTHARYNPKVFYGIKDPEDFVNIVSNVNALPPDQAIYFVWAYSSVTFLMEGLIEIEYDIQFKEPKDVPS